jgi:hypothetical protein
MLHACEKCNLLGNWLSQNSELLQQQLFFIYRTRAETTTEMADIPTTRTGQQVDLVYYQFVPALLCIQLVLVLLPRWLWSNAEGKLIDGLVDGKY